MKTRTRPGFSARRLLCFALVAGYSAWSAAALPDHRPSTAAVGPGADASADAAHASPTRIDEMIRAHYEAVYTLTGAAQPGCDSRTLPFQAKVDAGESRTP
jgi:hypothetical protein